MRWRFLFSLVLAVVLLSLATEMEARAPAPAKPADTNPLGMKFVKLPKGTFYMGGGGGEAGLKTEITTPFEIAICTVTQGQWHALMGNNPSYFSRTGKGEARVKGISDSDLERFPVEMVSWDDAQAFIKKLNEREHGRGWTYRLPTGAEWEYACRGGATSERQCSYDFYVAEPINDLSSRQANFNGTYPAGDAPKGPDLRRTTKVGSYLPNRLGIFDMHGNVSQWWSDKATDTDQRLYSAGSWIQNGYGCKASASGQRPQAHRAYYLGFRLVRVEAVSDGRRRP